MSAHAEHHGMRVIGGADVERLLPMTDCIPLMAAAFRALANGEVVQPLRSVIHLPGGVGSLYTMPGYLASPAAIAVKMVGVFAGNRARGLETHQGVVAVFDARTGEPRALIDAAAITAIRTAAVSGLATRMLAREEADDLAILGSGVQAGTHLAGMAAVRPVRRVRVWSPSPERLRAFVERARAAGTPAEAAASAEAAVRGAHLICTVTASPTPVLHGDWVAPGAHINAVGASTPRTRELDSALVARARLFVDRRESAAAEAGDYLIPRAEGVIGEDHILGELGDLVTERLQGRGSHEEVTVFKSLGLAVEDVAAAHYVHERAARENVGTVVHLWTTSGIANG